MSSILPNDNVLLQGLLNKVILYRFTRNFDKILQDRKISHAELSESTGRKGNWFNRTFNELEDMRISTFIKSVAAVTKILNERGQSEPIDITSIINEELIEIATVSIDLTIIDIEDLLSPDSGLTDFFLKLKVYVDSMKALNDIVSQEEADAYARVLERINQKER
jgi:hypothetical protein